MTCVVGLIGDECMVMGADSAGVAGSDLTIRKDPKVFTIRQKNGPDALLGFCGSFRMGQILMSLELPEDKSTGEGSDTHWRFLVNKVVPVIRKMLKEGGYSRVANNTETGGNFLLAYRGGMYEFDSDFQVGEPTTSYAAVGAGASYALGALDYMYNNLDLQDRSASDVVREVLEVAERKCTDVRGPMLIIEV